MGVASLFVTEVVALKLHPKEKTFGGVLPSYTTIYPICCLYLFRNSQSQCKILSADTLNRVIYPLEFL